MKIVTFKSETHGSIARIEMPMPAKGGKMKLGWNPVVIHAATCEEAERKADEFYHSELDRIAAKEANLIAGREKAKATRQANKEATQ